MKAHRIVLGLFLTLCFAAPDLHAQVPRGRDFRVNAVTSGQQWLADVATAPDGRFVVVWRDGGPVSPGVTMASIKARLFDPAGRPLGGEILVSRIRADAFGAPSVSLRADGGFVVVWGGGVENPFIAFGRRYAADGRALGGRFRLSRMTGRNQFEPDIAMAADGGFVAVWAQADGGVTEGPTTDILFRRFGPDGRPRGPEAVAIGGFEEQSSPRIAMRANGDFVVVGQHWAGEGSFYDVVARLFSSAGTARGEAFLVNNDSIVPEVSQFDPAVAMTSDGRFAISWTDRAADFGRDPEPEDVEDYTGIAIRFFASDGAPLGWSFPVNEILPGEQIRTEIGALPNGGYLLIWESGGGEGVDGDGLFGRVFGPNQKARGQEIRIPRDRAESQGYPGLALGPGGRGVAVWSSPDGSDNGIFARLIGPPRPGS